MEQFSVNTLAKILIVVGGLVLLAGIILLAAGKIPLVGKLPGDISIKAKSFSFYFPIVTCLVVSVVLTIILNLIFRR